MITYPNLYHLKYFADAVAFGSISKAAQENLVTHPAISRAISALEAHLGAALLEHRKKSFKPTEAGYRVAEQAQILLSAASDFEASSLSSREDQTIELKIGLTKTLSDIYLSPLLTEVKAKFPHTTTKVSFGTTNQIVEAVANRSVDLGLTIGNLSLATLSQTAIRKGQFLLVEGGPKMKWRGLFEAKSFILTEPRMETEKLKAAYNRRFGRALPVLFEVSSWDVIGRLVQQGMGVGLLPDVAVKSWSKGSFRILRTTWFESSYEIYVHRIKTQPVSRVVACARDALVNERL